MKKLIMVNIKKFRWEAGNPPVWASPPKGSEIIEEVVFNMDCEG